MNQLISLLHEGGFSCVIANHGETRTFSQRGVADLYELYNTDPTFMQGATIADKVVGKGAAALMIMGGMAEVTFVRQGSASHHQPPANGILSAGNSMRRRNRPATSLSDYFRIRSRDEKTDILAPEPSTDVTKRFVGAIRNKIRKL